MNTIINFLVTNKVMINNIIFSLLVGAGVYIFLRMLCNMAESEKERRKLKDANKIYIRRKRQFEGDEKGWKKWRDANYEITDIIEAGNYY